LFLNAQTWERTINLFSFVCLSLYRPATIATQDLHYCSCILNSFSTYLELHNRLFSGLFARAREEDSRAPDQLSEGPRACA
jgi:hypothetical protein